MTTIRYLNEQTPTNHSTFNNSLLTQKHFSIFLYKKVPYIIVFVILINIKRYFIFPPSTYHAVYNTSPTTKALHT